MPQFVNESSNGLSYLIKQEFRITSNLDIFCDIIDANIKLYQNVLFPPKFEINFTLNSTEKSLVELNIELENKECPSFPNSTMDESCK